jgi:hypothetical protein
MRCPAFGPRVSITEKCGLDDLMACDTSGRKGAISGSCKINKETLSVELQEELREKGVVVVPLPKDLINREKLDRKVCRQYALEEFAENLILIDTGHAKLMTSYFDLEDLRSIKGFENARYIDPYAASKSNSVRYMAVGIRNDYMQAEGMRNLFLAGEKSGFFVGHTEAISTGSLAGYNGARMASGKTLLKIPNTLSIGDLIEFSNEVVINERDTSRRFTFAGGEYFQRMKSKGIYTTDKEKIRREVEAEGLLDIYNHSYDVIE